jgi:hypothetical protein
MGRAVDDDWFCMLSFAFLGPFRLGRLDYDLIPREIQRNMAANGPFLYRRDKRGIPRS